MVASVVETESSASSTSSGRHSAGLPIVGPPRGLFATGLSWRKILFRFFPLISLSMSLCILYALALEQSAQQHACRVSVTV